MIDVIDASGLVDAQTGTEAKSMPETESAIVDESGKEAGEGKLPGWTLAVHVGMPLLAAAIAVGCRASACHGGLPHRSRPQLSSVVFCGSAPSSASTFRHDVAGNQGEIHAN
ncbi:hypothetical protein [Burkholderia contaminans]|uniref:hypothetical protein n=1 Tax=Burkholderia contaminans TaxID=488447 RepID=UPI0011886D3F|nr:hypothetical protein [Burkholderia contaminans]QDS32420.1 hypothetical protein FPQ37_41635 [Burkholderia contaminans]